MLPFAFQIIPVLLTQFAITSSLLLPQEVCFNNPLHVERKPVKQLKKPILQHKQAPTVTDNNGLKSVFMASVARNIILKPAEKCTGIVIFLHGLGDTGHGWSAMFDDTRKDKHIQYIFPNAPTMPVTLNFGMQMPSWFDIESLDMNAKEDKTGIEKARNDLRKLISEAQQANDVPSNRVVIGGFSMGAALALYTALTHPEPLGGVIGLSTWLPLREEFLVKDGPASNFVAPVFQGHGNADPMVREVFGKKTNEVIKTNTKCSDATYKTYNGLGHSSCPQEMVDVRKFLEKYLPRI